MKDELLHVIAVISNPIRFRSRYALFEEFIQQCKASNAHLWIVETAFGERPHMCTTCTNPQHIQLRTSCEIWHKENMINIAMSRLPSDWKYVAWVDADITFTRPDWAAETVHQLQHYKFVQMFSHALDLGPYREPIQHHQGFGFCYIESLRQGSPMMPKGDYYYTFEKDSWTIKWHPGYAWAARREAIDAVGGLMDFAILGAADHHMARALIGDGIKTLPKNIGKTYQKKVQIWQDLAERHIRRDIGYVPGTITHNWHGPKRKRYYAERWKCLTTNDYDPDLDLKRDSQGLYVLTDRNIKLRDDIRAYFRSRDEDALS